MKMKTSKKLKATLGVVVLAGIFATTGTFAWTSMSQRALNEGSMTLSPGARVHDDYEGFESILLQNGGLVNKDIFAENYSNKPVFARIKLTEYMETGEGAGKYELSGADNIMTPSPENKAKVFEKSGLDKAKMNDRSTWPAYLPEGTLADGEKSGIRDYITWDLGDDNADRKIYMPTFNQNNDSQESDTTGQAIEELTWTTNTNYDTTQNPLPGTHNEWTLGEKHTSTLRKYDEKNNQEVKTEGIEHTAVATGDPSQKDGYMTMKEWQAANEPTGNFWVHDNDGWIYWANPVAAHSATSLLLDKLDVAFTPDDMYYTINVVSDFATPDDIDQWTGVSPEAQSLLNKIN